MQAIVLSAYGDASRLELNENYPEPEPGPDQIKVRVQSASLNPIDWKLRSGAMQAYMPLQLPTLLGRDAAGEVVSVGSGVTAFKVGDQVLGLVNAAYAQFVVAPVDAWAKLPAGLSAKDAGALPLVLLTGDQLAQATLGAEPAAGRTVLVTGALGGVGRVAAWSLQQRGARVLAGVRKSQLEDAQALGVAGAVALDDAAALAALPPLDAVADTVNGETIAQLVPKIKGGGAIGSVLGEPKGAKERGLRVTALFAHPDSARLRELAAAVASGSLVIPIAKRFPLAEARAAHEFAERGSAGKVLLLPFGP